MTPNGFRQAVWATFAASWMPPVLLLAVVADVSYILLSVPIGIPIVMVGMFFGSDADLDRHYRLRCGGRYADVWPDTALERLWRRRLQRRRALPVARVVDRGDARMSRARRALVAALRVLSALLSEVADWLAEGTRETDGP